MYPNPTVIAKVKRMNSDVKEVVVMQKREGGGGDCEEADESQLSDLV